MPEVQSTACCGNIEINGVSEFRTGQYKEWFRSLHYELANEFNHTRDWVWPTFLTFTDAKRPGSRTQTGGDKLAAFIEKKGFGSVTYSRWEKNHNTDNNIKIWVWRTNTDALNRYIRSITPRDLEDF